MEENTASIAFSEPSQFSVKIFVMTEVLQAERTSFWIQAIEAEVASFLEALVRRLLTTTETIRRVVRNGYLPRTRHPDLGIGSTP